MDSKFSKDQNRNSLPWNLVEKAINKEVRWLKGVVLESPHDKACKDCILRRIAILIVSGRIRAKHIKTRRSLFCINDKRLPNLPPRKAHGKEWHNKMMDVAINYFKSSGHRVVLEPNLNKGKADLGVFKNNKSLFIEIGTVSLSKLLINLESMKGSTFLIVIDNNQAIEFSVLKSGYK
jgi:hypothetical protein